MPCDPAACPSLRRGVEVAGAARADVERRGARPEAPGSRGRGARRRRARGPPCPRRVERFADVAHRVLHRVDERVVAEVRPAVVHVEQRDVHDAAGSDARQRPPAAGTRAYRKACVTSAAASRRGRPRGRASARCWQSNGMQAPLASGRGATRNDGTWPPPEVTLARPLRAQPREEPGQLARGRDTARSRRARRGTPPGAVISTYGNISRRTAISPLHDPRARRRAPAPARWSRPMPPVVSQPERHTAAAVLVVGLDDELVALAPDVTRAGPRAAPSAVVRVSASTRVHGTWAATSARSSWLNRRSSAGR